MQNTWRENAIDKLTSYFQTISEMHGFDLFTLQVAVSLVARSQNILTNFANEGNESTVGEFLVHSSDEKYREIIQNIGYHFIDSLFSSHTIHTILLPHKIETRKDLVWEAFTNGNFVYSTSKDTTDSYEYILKSIGFHFIHPRLLRKLDSMIKEELEELRFTFEKEHCNLL